MYNLLESKPGNASDYIQAIKALRTWAEENLGANSLKAAKDFVDATRDLLRADKTRKIEQFIRDNGLEAVDVVVSRMKDENYTRNDNPTWNKY